MDVDDEIMARSLDDPPAFGAMFDRYFDAIHGYLARRLGRDVADDLAGEVFRIAFDNRAAYDSRKGSVRPWLYGIAANAIRRRLRDDNRAERAWLRLSADTASNDLERLADRLDAERTMSTLVRALDELRRADREALMLFAVEDLAYAEIAAVMRSPIGTVRSRITVPARCYAPTSHRSPTR